VARRIVRVVLYIRLSPCAMKGGSQDARLRPAAKRALRVGAVGQVVRSIGALRGRGLVLVYHRVVEGETPAFGIVPTVTADLFRRQVEALAEVGKIVSLHTLLDDLERHAKPRFALTFDDDYLTHTEHVLPILQALDLPATFFLSGRSLHGLGSYWFEILERLVLARGIGEVGRLLKTPPDGGIEGLGVAGENDPARQKVVEAETPDVPRLVGRAHIAALADAGMEIGFHTLHHEVLPRLEDRAIRAALMNGRTELEMTIGSPIQYFAYPHGQADHRTGKAVRNAGYEAAWTGRPQSMHRGSERYLLGRWEPGQLQVDDLLVGTAVRLNHGAPP
jgi:peptidoglycan/xylan/chitin deacetylase (PgdA/CDA1 family)